MNFRHRYLPPCCCSSNIDLPSHFRIYKYANVNRIPHKYIYRKSLARETRCARDSVREGFFACAKARVA